MRRCLAAASVFVARFKGLVIQGYTLVVSGVYRFYKKVRKVWKTCVEWTLMRLTGLSKAERILAGVSLLDIILLNPHHSSIVASSKLDSIVIKRMQQHLADQHLSHSYELNYDQMSDTLCEALNIHHKSKYLPLLRQVFQQLKVCASSQQTILDLLAIPYDSNNPEHCQIIKHLWINLKGGDLASVPSLSDNNASERWSEIGFQSLPHRDFRHAGLLGALNLLWFSEHHTFRAQAILRDTIESSSQQKCWYPFAATGLNITIWLILLLNKGFLDIFFYSNPHPPLQTFNTIYSFVALEFSRFWRLCRPANVMQFGEISNRFREQIHATLADIAQESAHSEWTIPVLSTGENLTAELKCWIDGQVPVTQPTSRWIRRLAALSV